MDAVVDGVNYIICRDYVRTIEQYQKATLKIVMHYVDTCEDFFSSYIPQAMPLKDSGEQFQLVNGKRVPLVLANRDVFIGLLLTAKTSHFHLNPLKITMRDQPDKLRKKIHNSSVLDGIQK
jgi:hypothetical protein